MLSWGFVQLAAAAAVTAAAVAAAAAAAFVAVAAAAAAAEFPCVFENRVNIIENFDVMDWIVHSITS